LITLVAKCCFETDSIFHKNKVFKKILEPIYQLWKLTEKMDHHQKMSETW